MIETWQKKTWIIHGDQQLKKSCNVKEWTKKLTIWILNWILTGMMMIVLESNAVAPTPLKDGLKGSSAAASKKTTATLILEGGSWMSHKHTHSCFTSKSRNHIRNILQTFSLTSPLFLYCYAKCKSFWLFEGKKCRTSLMTIKKNDLELRDSKVIQNDSKRIKSDTNVET